MLSYARLLKTEDALIRSSRLGRILGSALARKGKGAFRKTQIARVVAITPMLLAVHGISHPAHAANLTKAAVKQDTPDDGLVDVTGTVDPDAISESTVIADPTDDTVLTVELVLPFQDPAAVEAFVDSVSDPDNPNFRNYCTPDQFAAWFGPTDDLFNDVADYVED